jgi:hypothetical protein
VTLKDRVKCYLNKIIFERPINNIKRKLFNYTQRVTYIFSATLFSSCSKDDSDAQFDVLIIFNLLINKDWFPPEEDVDFLCNNFNSNGNYSENGFQDGTWS